ncbi:plasmid partitioning protein RepB [Mesorhizobium sp. M1A.F.Ca.IN.022.05.2.1]|uniref:plasmid partitioning protein RepB n=2 Tax=Mesorhizobium TaxID=68287 RepID=UPI000FC9BAB3|nr:MULTISPECIES: plasmid partitioning protein RepB [unclassified Mesorhizobium]RUV81260.1 plasmid partitioning protein RepB [Mesorhizobium sp. M1A.F.Ca.IN.020.32.1.1]RUW04818.1 plasmid partitioning protein RepB [Mesorhizobium sp. M1A.F.Ca.IN.022.05.2.1]RWF74197.1 MAG: plasmid partitioning protein RepB [Mesorhizobium sp.]RWF94472.1 MAG: plasmid partitioning protein RepB [Mesorhizobium sp.]RWG73748.1 MAG: plasmid partitioning protein RepB [Mesorhizobium sp.]
MARKNLFEVSEPSGEQTPPDAARTALVRPLMGLDRPLQPGRPVGAISQSLENINSRAQRAEEIERKLSEGQAVVELDPSVIDQSIVVDRLGVSDERRVALVDQIREHGQQVPILVRPHPEKGGHYQVAYGHRRLAAVRQLGRMVRAVVRDLTDEQLVVSQGQENNSRSDLSYIERCYFAAKLEAKGFSRDIIMASLGVDKAALSRMIALVARLPAEIIEAIGTAESVGRQKWAELADLLEEKGKRAKALKAIQDSEFAARMSDERFQAIYDLVKTAAKKPDRTMWTAANGSRLVTINESEAKMTFAFDKRIEPEFASFVRERLQALYDEFRQKITD